MTTKNQLRSPSVDASCAYSIHTAQNYRFFLARHAWLYETMSRLLSLTLDEHLFSFVEIHKGDAAFWFNLLTFV